MVSDDQGPEAAARESLGGNPHFIVEHGGRLYVAVAVLEYDMDDTQSAAGSGEVRTMFDKALRKGALKAAPLTSRSDWAAALNSGPVPPRPPII